MVSPTNASAIIVGKREGKEVTRWAGALDWQGAMPIEFIGERRGKEWSWKPHEPAELQIDADLDRRVGIEIAEWARQHKATWVQVIIVPALHASPETQPDNTSTGANGKPPGALDADADAPDAAATPDAPDADADAVAAPDAEPATDADAALDADARVESSIGLSEQGAGAGPGQHGDPDDSGIGSVPGRKRGYTSGSEDPSWHDNPRAELVIRNAGRTPADGGKKGGSAGGEQDGDGNIHGLGLWGGLLDAPEAVAPLVSAGLILADASFISFGQKFLSRVVRGMGMHALRKEIRQEAAQVVAREVTKVKGKLGRSPAFKKLSKREQRELLGQSEEALERAYYERAGIFFREQAQQHQDIATRYATATDRIDQHIHRLATENAAAYRKMAEAADEVLGPFPKQTTKPRLLSPRKPSKVLRSQPGTASGGHNLGEASGQWLRGTSGNAAPMPRQVADALRGQTFKNWDEFRAAVWKAIADDKTLNKAFTPDNLRRMRSGLAPKVDPSQRLGNLDSYVLHHVTPIQHGGGVYDLDNLRIVTPRVHKEILDTGYHYRRKGR